MMYSIKKTLTVSASHALDHLDYDSPCKQVHGHNWKITVFCQSMALNKNGMVVDFSEISDIVRQIDHKHINNVLACPPTAENIARWVHNQIPTCYYVEVQESDGNVAGYGNQRWEWQKLYGGETR